MSMFKSTKVAPALAKCPFCGSDAVVIGWFASLAAAKPVFYARCSECEALRTHMHTDANAAAYEWEKLVKGGEVHGCEQPDEIHNCEQPGEP